jgi:peptidoglycan/LPS O-acetylase OafA/YrhL
MAEHLQGCILGRVIAPWAATGQHGVNIFFVLSGFLITTKLMDGPVNLRVFYVRRFFRLAPVAWSYLIFLLLVQLSMRIQFVSMAELKASMLFYRNFIGPTAYFGTRHFWSLSLEEQFYLAWPPFLALFGKKNCKWIAGGGALACTGYRLMNWHHYNHLWASFETQVRVDSLLLGCLLALLRAEPQCWERIERFARVAVIPSLCVLLYCMMRFHVLPPFSESLAIALLITVTISDTSVPMFRWLEVGPLVYLGTISYSLYVWQGFFLGFHFTNTVESILMIIMLALFSVGSFLLIEQPCIRFGRAYINDTSDSERKPASASR